MFGERDRPELEEDAQSREDSEGDVIVDVRQGFDYAFSCRDGGGAIERYLKGEYKLHLHIVLRLKRKVRDYCLSFQHALMDQNGIRMGPEPILIEDPKTDPREITDNRMNEAVLVDIRKLMENPERVDAKLIPSAIRLKPLDDCVSEWINSLNPVQSAAASGSVEMGGVDSWPALPIFVPHDRELKFLLDFGRERLSEGFGKVKDQVIETAPHVLNAVPDDEAERVDGGTFRNGFYGGVPEAECAVRFRSDRISVFIKPLRPFRLELFQMVMRP